MKTSDVADAPTDRMTPKFAPCFPSPESLHAAITLVTRHRDKAITGGGTWQSWNRILTLLNREHEPPHA